MTAAPLLSSRRESLLTPGNAWHAWVWQPAAAAVLLVTAVVYLWGARTMWREAGRGRALPAWRAGGFAAGLVAVAVALFSPLDPLGGQLCAAHMIQHLLLLTVAAPLLAEGAPSRAMLWAFPAAARRGFGRWWHRRPVLQWGAGLIGTPPAAWVLSVAALVLWHLPGPYRLALGDERVHALEHFSFLATGFLFWWVVLRPDGYRRLEPGAGVLYVFTAGLPAGLLGALLTFAGRPLYAGQSAGAPAWGLTALGDQQLAGLLMWMPGGLVYLAAAAMFFVAWLRQEERRALRRAAIAAGIACVALLPGIAACKGRNRPVAGVSGNPRAGKELIATFGCGACHTIPGVAGARGMVGPPLTQFAGRAYIAGEVPNTERSLIQWIMNPQSIEPGTAMPNLGVSQAEARDIAAYLYTLR
jgi:putative membrane protein